MITLSADICAVKVSSTGSHEENWRKHCINIKGIGAVKFKFRNNCPITELISLSLTIGFTAPRYLFSHPFLLKFIFLSDSLSDFVR